MEPSLQEPNGSHPEKPWYRNEGNPPCHPLCDSPHPDDEFRVLGSLWCSRTVKEEPEFDVAVSLGARADPQTTGQLNRELGVDVFADGLRPEQLPRLALGLLEAHELMVALEDAP